MVNYNVKSLQAYTDYKLTWSTVMLQAYKLTPITSLHDKQTTIRSKQAYKLTPIRNK